MNVVTAAPYRSWENCGEPFNISYLESPKSVHLPESVYIRSGWRKELNVLQELKWLRERVEKMSCRVGVLEPLARKHAAFRIWKWWRRMRARANWNFLREYLTTYATAKASWNAHLNAFALSNDKT